jgi:acetyltransferase-like isoleucine patch superfamily enzyme
VASDHALEVPREPQAPLFLRGLRLVLADPGDAARTARALVRGRIDLRSCGEVGLRPRVYGRCKVTGGSGIRIGERLLMLGETVRGELTTHSGGRLEIGDRVFINYGCSISAHTLVRIGDLCNIGQYAILLDCDYHNPRHDGGHGEPAPVVLEDGVWLAARVTVLKGVTIGRGSIVAAGSVVTKDVPPGVIAAGVPARVVREL